MEDSALKAIVLGMNIFIFVGALTAGIILNTSVGNAIDVSFTSLDLNNKDIYTNMNYIELDKTITKNVTAQEIYYEIINGVYEVWIGNVKVDPSIVNTYINDFGATYQRQYDIDSNTGKVNYIKYVKN